MVYRKRSKVSRRRKPRADVAKRLRRVERKVNQNMPELKYSNTLLDSTTTTYDGALYQLFAPAQGDSDITRDGDEIRVQGFMLRWFFNSAVNSCAARVIVFIDKQNFMSAVTDVFESSTLGAARATSSINAQYVHDYKDRITVLSDKTYHFSANGTNTLAPKRFYKMRGMRMRFLAGATTLEKNALKMIVISGNAAGSTPSITYQGRIWYTDA
nr:capsid protein [Banfec virus 6]